MPPPPQSPLSKEGGKEKLSIGLPREDVLLGAVLGAEDKARAVDTLVTLTLLYGAPIVDGVFTIGHTYNGWQYMDSYLDSILLGSLDLSQLFGYFGELRHVCNL